MHASDQARFLEVIDEVESHGLSASRLIFKPLEGNLWEIKFSTPAAGYRVLYVMVEKDLDLARKRLKEVLR